MLNRTFIPFPILNTQRLMLRQLTLTDEHDIYNLRSDTEVNKYLGRQPAKTLDDARTFISKINDNIAKNDALYWAVILNDKNRMVGTICLFSFSDGENSCEIGYELLPKFQGHGIMTEAVEKVIEYAFNTIGVDTIKAFFHKENRGSINLLEKFSFLDSNRPDETDPDLIYYHLNRST